VDIHEEKLGGKAWRKLGESLDTQRKLGESLDTQGKAWGKPGESLEGKSLEKLESLDE
jgi:hypothetical protein